MLEIRAKLKIPRTAYKLEVRGTLKLPFEARQKSGLKARLASGEEVGLMLPRGEILRGGDLVTASDGRVIEVLCESEKVLHVECGTPADMARAAYQLGERHVPVQIGEGFLRLAADPVLEELLKQLGARVTHEEAPFEPEAGIHAGGHRRHDETGHGGEIHHHHHAERDHVHDEHCGHDHHHRDK